VPDADLAADAAAAHAEMREAYARTVATPYPAAAGAFADVQDVGSPRTEAF
jgi:pyruvate dehydrogenase E1 component alpha subunit